MAPPKITALQQRKIEIILTGWKGKLTWGALVRRIELELSVKTTRQTLCTYLGINKCYQTRKAELRGVTPALFTNIVASDVKMAEQIDSLKAEIAVLSKNNSEQLRMIERMLANAIAIPNLDLHALTKRRPEEF